MSRPATNLQAQLPAPGERLLGPLLALAVPVIFEQVSHNVVGLTDVWLANNLPHNKAESTAAIGTIAYLIWFIGLIVAAVGTGSTALISRARGAHHRRLANSVCGQSVTAAFLLGLTLTVVMFCGAGIVVELTRLSPGAKGLANSYLRMLTPALPFMTLMFVANACLRGAGDTLTPAISMIVVDVVNMACSAGLSRGLFGLPNMGFDGIAIGTMIAYITGGLLQFFVLLRGRGGIRLHLHRLRPHWQTLRRVLRIGVPSGVEGLLIWIAQFSVLIVINQMDSNSIAAAAHINAVRIEGMSYMPGFAFAMAAATMTGHALGAKDPRRAARATYLAWAAAASIMSLCGIIFIFAGRFLAGLMLPDEPQTADLTARCLFITGFIQAGFAGAIVFSGALRGAGDTISVMIINLSCIIGLRLVGVLVAVRYFNLALPAVWIVLSSELFIRGLLVWGRFAQGKWKHVEV